MINTKEDFFKYLNIKEDKQTDKDIIKIQARLSMFGLKCLGLSSREIGKLDRDLPHFTTIAEHVKEGEEYFNQLYPSMDLIMNSLQERIKNADTTEKKLKLLPEFMKNQLLLFGKSKSLENGSKNKEK